MPIREYQSISLKDYVSLELKGKGGFGLVRKCFNKNTGDDVVIKFNTKGNSANEENILNMIKEIPEKHNKNEKKKYLIEYYGKYTLPHNNQKMFIMEYGNCCLADILKAGKKYNNEEILYVLYYLVAGFAFLQENGIAHGDIKPGNIILKTLKLARILQQKRIQH